MNRILFRILLVLALAVTHPAPSQEVETATPPLDITITPPRDDTMTLDRLGQLFEDGRISGGAFAAVAISIAEQSYNAGDYKRAEAEIADAKKRIEALEPQAWLALAALDEAGAKIDRAQGDLYHWVRKAKSAADTIARSLGPDHPTSLIARIRASGAYFDAAAGEAPPVTLDSPRGAELMSTDYEIAARQQAEQVLDDARAALGEQHRVTLMAELNLVSFASAGGQHEQAEESLRNILAKIDSNLDDHGDVARGAAQMLAGILAKKGQSEEARKILALHAADESLVQIDPANARLRQASASRFTARSTFTPDDRETTAGNFADISFCISSSGEVFDATILNARGSGRWQSQILEALQSRRYLPSAALGEHCTPQFERIAVAARSVPARRSRIRRRATEIYIVTTDLLQGGSLSSGILDESPRHLPGDTNLVSSKARN